MFKLNHIFRNVRYRGFDHMENLMLWLSFMFETNQMRKNGKTMNEQGQRYDVSLTH